MKKLKIDVVLSIGFANADRKDTIEIEIDGDETPEQIDKLAGEACRDWMWNYIDYSYEIKTTL